MALIVYPKTRFTLTKSQSAGVLSAAQYRRLIRKPGVPGLERELSARLRQMPQLCLRGSSDRRAAGDSAYLITSTPIKWHKEWMLSPKECRPPLFFRRLFATVEDSTAMGLGHLFADAAASELVLTLDRGFGRQERIGMGEGHPRRTIFGYTFPKTMRTFDLLGQLRYQRAAVESVLDLNQILERVQVRQLQITGFVYRDTLRLMVELARAGWE